MLFQKPNAQKLYSEIQSTQENHPIRFVQLLNATNPIALVKKKPKYSDKPSDRDNAQWFLKHERDIFTSICEVVANEFFRLIIPEQPKTRLVSQNQSHSYFLMSKEAVGFRPLCQETKKGNRQTNKISANRDIEQFCDGVKTGRYKNFGLITVVSLYLNEIDLKITGNIGVDAADYCIKLDGGCCFANLVNQDNNIDQHTFTHADIATLPYLSTYHPYNWLDIVVNQKNNKTSRFQLIDPTMITNPFYRTEVNIGLLRILLIPDSYLDAFVTAYVNHNTFSKTRLYEQLTERKKMCMQAAVSDPSFCAFMATNQAAEEKKLFTQRLHAFKTYRKHTVVVKDLEQQCDQQFTDIKNQINNKRKKPLSTPWKMGFISGASSTATVLTALILLRVVDVATLGVSLPVTILLSVIIVLAAGGLGAGVQQYFNKPNFTTKTNRSPNQLLSTDSPRESGNTVCTI